MTKTTTTHQHIKKNSMVVAAILTLAIALPTASPAFARDIVMKTASVPNNGARISTMILERGKRYRLDVSGFTHFGTWKPTRRALKNDACFEFNSGRGQVSLPVLKSSHSFNLCWRGYSANHNYSSQIIYGDGRRLVLWVYDSDYRDNYGLYYAKVVLIN